MTIKEKAIAQTKPDPEKYCVFCGKRMHRVRFESGRLEDLSAFKRRKYCCRECMSKAFIKQGNTGQTLTPAHHTAREIVYKIYKKPHMCEICGSIDRIEVHHIDHNESNNVIENLMIVCRSCHGKLHRKNRICSVEGCNRPHKGHGYCDFHLQRYRKTGNPLLTKFDLKNYDNKIQLQR